jgi:hypothetical protein
MSAALWAFLSLAVMLMSTLLTGESAVIEAASWSDVVARCSRAMTGLSRRALVTRSV